MVVNNALELYSVYLGWREYDVIFSALFQVGLTLLPFILLIFQNLTTPFEMPVGSGAETSFKRVTIELIFMVIMFMLCVYPNWPLKISEIEYTPHCSTTGVVSTPGHSGTSYDELFNGMISGGEMVLMPPAFALLFHFASGFTHGLIQWGVPCSTNVLDMMTQLNVASFSNDLSTQIQQFNQQCFQRANHQFHAQRPDDSQSQAIMQAHGGEEDLKWMGSYTYQTLYYDDLMPDQPVTGFPYTSFRSPYVDDAVSRGEIAEPDNGYPTCNQWWHDAQYGIKQRVVNEANALSNDSPYLGKPNLQEQVKNYLSNVKQTWATQLDDDDFIVYNAIYDSQNTPTFTSDFNANRGVMGNVADAFFDLSQLQDRYFRDPMRRAAISEIYPIIQAMLLLFVVMFAPMVLVLGRYRFHVFFTLGIVMFAILFSSFIWAYLGFLENTLMESLSSPTLGVNQYLNHSVLVNVFTMLYLLVPLTFISLLGLSGYHIGSTLEHGMVGGNRMANSDAKALPNVSKLATSSAKFLK